MVVARGRGLAPLAGFSVARDSSSSCRSRGGGGGGSSLPRDAIAPSPSCPLRRSSSLTSTVSSSPVLRPPCCYRRRTARRPSHDLDGRLLRRKVAYLHATTTAYAFLLPPILRLIVSLFFTESGLTIPLSGWVMASALRSIFVVVFIRPLSRQQSQQSSCRRENAPMSSLSPPSSLSRTTILFVVVVIIVNDGKRTKQQPACRRRDGEDDDIDRRGKPGRCRV